jgi:hypothetical protein
MKIAGLRRLEETVIRVPSVGDNWHMSWADDDRQYVSLCDGSGFPGLPRADYNSRCYAIAGDPPGVRFDYLPGYPTLLTEHGSRAVNRYYNYGILALDGAIYQFLSTPNRPFAEPLPRFAGVKLIYSPDSGVTWCNQDGSTPVRWEPWDERNHDNMLFFEEPGEPFSLLTVLQMGQNYEHNRDGHVYIYAPNGNVEGTMNQTVLCRVPKDRILHRDAYEFYAGPRPDGSAQWSPRIEERAPVHTFPAGWVNRIMHHPYAWHPSVVYYPATGEYLMANWGMGIDEGGDWFGKPSYLGFWTAPQPWGPWTQVHEEQAWMPGHDANARAYQPQVSPKWIAADGRSFWLVWTDFQLLDGGRPYYAFNTQQVEVRLA